MQPFAPVQQPGQQQQLWEQQQEEAQQQRRQEQLAQQSVASRSFTPAGSTTSSGRRPVELYSSEADSAATSPARTSTPPVTGLQVLGTGVAEVGGEAGALAGMGMVVEGLAYAGFSAGDEPLTLHEALAGQERAEWQKGAEKEVNAMRDMGVWDREPVELPPGKRAVGVKYVFRRKTDQDGNVVQHKVRLVAKGFTQVPGEDFGQVFAPVGKFTTGRVLLALAAVKGWHVHQEDVDHAFLNGVLNEEVYVCQPEGFDDGTGRVYRLRKALYGLKQAPRVWNEEIGTTLVAAGFTRSVCDEALYVKFDGNDPVFVLVYVDDLLLVSPRMDMIGKVKASLAAKYQMKDLGEVSMYLGVQVRRSLEEGWLEIGQEKYIRGLRERFGSLLTKQYKVHTPMDVSELRRIRSGIWSEKDSEPAEVKVYQSIIGSLMFAACTTRPDMSFTVNTLAQSSVAPKQIHMRAALRALRYLTDTATRVIRYSRQGGEQVVGYTDSDFGSEADGRSRAGYVFKVGGGAVSWYSKKLEGVANSTAEEEYNALSEGAKEAIWLKRLMGELHVGDGGAIPLFCDNESAIALAHNPVLHQRTKHIHVAWHFVRDAVRQQEVVVESVRSHLQDADMLTKALPGLVLNANLERIGMAVKMAVACAKFADSILF